MVMLYGHADLLGGSGTCSILAAYTGDVLATIVPDENESLLHQVRHIIAEKKRVAAYFTMAVLYEGYLLQFKDISKLAVPHI